MIVNTCLNATDPNIGLALGADEAARKCYMADTGLLVTHTFMDMAFTDNELYKVILFEMEKDGIVHLLLYKAMLL